MAACPSEEEQQQPRLCPQRGPGSALRRPAKPYARPCAPPGWVGESARGAGPGPPAWLLHACQSACLTVAKTEDPDKNKPSPCRGDQAQKREVSERRVALRVQSLHQQTTSGLLPGTPPKHPLRPGLRHRSPVLAPVRTSPCSAWCQPVASARRFPVRL
ncbi:uncharacterized protein LOC126050970 isoform X2 [Accipiter gentilis]|uniref:uncharacterized protein LOC126050970 isoform X2 n=1 Tax=Astur gentilis TaxID=8957 RepID=UPI00210F31B0|nr:uncharacterized protein LOC126050970 isoform X2 [Accipiter gentilis]